MTKKELKAKIEALEQRIAVLEAQNAPLIRTGGWPMPKTVYIPEERRELTFSVDGDITTILDIKSC